MQNALARLKNAGLLLIAIFSSAIFVGCDYFRIPSEVRKSLKAAGDNKEQLLAVIEHFRHDSEKLEAAYYLISNMPGHYSIEGNSVFEPAFDKIKPILKEEGKTRENGAIFTKLIDSIRQVNPPSLTIREDIKTISSDFLIQNIDLAFEAYHSIPAHLRCDWDTFLKFVLPYRSLQEPIESGLREYFFNNYNWVFERMEKSGSLQNVICELLDSLNFKWDVLYNIPHQMPLSNVYEIGIANTCDLLVTMYAVIFRSLGIPAAYDFTPRSHSWIVFMMQDTFYAVETKRIVNTLYRYAPFPKIYRRTFERNKTNTFPPNSFDVTGQYRNTINIPFNSVKKANKAHLKVFNPSRGWITVDESIRKKGEIIFNDVGKNVVYAIGEVLDDETKVTNSLFYVNNKREIIHLKAEQDNTITAVLTRKFPPFELRNLHKIQWVKSINGAEIQAANSADFSDALTLVRIENFNSSNKRVIKTGNKEKFRNYRLVSPDSSVIDLSGFHLIKDDTVIMTDWQVFSATDQHSHRHGHSAVIDNEPLTYFSDRYMTVNYYFDEPVAISEFQVHARNDDNNVKSGDHYELMYWDDGWISAGSKYANDTLLVYENIPSGTLYWLKNLTEGIEEQTFLLDKDGYQYWPGVTSYNDSYHEFIELEGFCND